MKKFMLVMLVTSACQYAFAQDSAKAYLVGYENNTQIYFDSLNNRSSCEWPDIKTSYSFFVTFNIDHDSRITNYKTLELPVAKVPEDLTAYVRRLFVLSEKNWAVRSHRKPTTSERVIFNVSILVPRQTLEEKMKRANVTAEYLLSAQPHGDKELENILFAKATEYITLLVGK